MTKTEYGFAHTIPSGWKLQDPRSRWFVHFIMFSVVFCHICLGFCHFPNLDADMESVTQSFNLIISPPNCTFQNWKSGFSIEFDEIVF